MNLAKLFEAQRKLDEHIIREKGLEGQDLLDKKILALLVELGELANEWRGFKYWSNDQEPRTNVEIECPDCNGYGVTNFDAVFEGFAEMECKLCNKTGILGYANQLLEEYVDCLHFILSIGLDLENTDIIIDVDCDYTGFSATDTFLSAFEKISELADAIENKEKLYIYQVYEELFNIFVDLGNKYLGFTWEQVEEAYFQKNAVNHRRQDSGVY